MSPPRSSSVGHLFERAGLVGLGAPDQSGHRLAQRAAEQRVIVGNDEMIGLGIVQFCVPIVLYRSLVPAAGRGPRRGIHPSSLDPRNCSMTSRW